MASGIAPASAAPATPDDPPDTDPGPIRRVLPAPARRRSR
jgi:hypothetical protein